MNVQNSRGLARAIGIILFIAVMTLGMLLRVWGIDFGLPYLYHPDEPNKIQMAQTMFKTGDLNPHYFKKPSLFIYLNALAYVPYYLVGKCLGLFQRPSDIPSPMMLAMGVGWAPMPTVILMGRLLTTLFSLFSILMIFVIGRKVSHSIAVGVLAALMIAVSPTNVINSHYIATNAFLVFSILVVLWASIDIYRKGETRYYVIAGIAAGLAISFKYPGGIALLIILAAHLLRHGWQGFREYRLDLALALVPLTFLATTPFALLDHRTFLSDFFFEARHYSEGHAGMEGNALRWYLSYLWQAEGVVVLLALLGALYGLYAHTKMTVLVLTFPLVYFIFISSFEVRNDRTLLPFTPFVFLTAASLLVASFTHLSTIKSTTARNALAMTLVLVTAIGLIWPLQKTVVENLRLTTIDGRETGRIWIADTVPPGSRIALEAYSPYVDPTEYSVQGFGRIIDHPPAWYVTNGFDFIVFSMGMYGRFYGEADKYPDEVARYDAFFDNFDLVQQFADGGFEIKIYRVVE